MSLADRLAKDASRSVMHLYPVATETDYRRFREAVAAACNAALRQMQAEAATVARTACLEHAETVDKSHPRRLVRTPAELIVAAIEAL